MANFYIPAATDRLFPDYTQSTIIDGREYNLRFYWKQRMGTWYLDIKDQDNVMIVAGLALVLGSLILRYLTDPKLPAGEIFMVDLTDAGLQPNIDELSERVQVAFIDSFPT